MLKNSSEVCKLYKISQDEQTEQIELTEQAEQFYVEQMSSS